MAINEHTLHERVAVLEVRMDDLDEIKEKLDSLVELKSKGMGALWLVSIIIGSGILGLIATVMAFFRGGTHL